MRKNQKARTFSRFANYLRAREASGAKLATLEMFMCNRFATKLVTTSYAFFGKSLEVHWEVLSRVLRIRGAALTLHIEHSEGALPGAPGDQEHPREHFPEHLQRLPKESALL